MKQILECALEQMKARKAVVLATVTQTKGSTPRKRGAMMVVGVEGVLVGSIGGGALEHECKSLAQSMIGQARGEYRWFELDNSKAGALGMICGGSAEILFTPINEMESIEEVSSIYKDDKSENKEKCFLSLNVEEVSIVSEGEMKKEQTSRIDMSDMKRFYIAIEEKPVIYIFGGGHVSLEVAKLLDGLDFPYYVVDDRDEFACKERFPNAKNVRKINFKDLQEMKEGEMNLTIGANDGVCVMTRGHEGDADVLRYALGTKASYIGLMGSKRKKIQTFQTLIEEGYEGVEERIITPIGLDIGAQTPQELAISVVAELIQWRRGRF